MTAVLAAVLGLLKWGWALALPLVAKVAPWALGLGGSAAGRLVGLFPAVRWAKAGAYVVAAIGLGVGLWSLYAVGHARGAGGKDEAVAAARTSAQAEAAARFQRHHVAMIAAARLRARATEAVIESLRQAEDRRLQDEEAARLAATDRLARSGPDKSAVLKELNR